jgi:hypothetical protein
MPGLVAIARTRLVGGSPLSVIGIMALGYLQRDRPANIRTELSSALQQVRYCANMGREARPFLTLPPILQLRSSPVIN